MVSVLLFFLAVTGMANFMADILPGPVLKPIFILISLQIAEMAYGVAAKSGTDQVLNFADVNSN